VSLFNKGIFHLFSGRTTDWVIDCNALSQDDWECIRNLVLERHPNFSHVAGVSTNGKRLADLLSSFCTNGDVLLVDDVLKVNVMHAHRLYYRTRQEYHDRDVSGYVIFACVPCPTWVRALWQLDVRRNVWEPPL